jgi:hypothetical protein
VRFELALDWDTRRFEGYPVACATVERRGELHRLVRISRDETDPSVTEIDKVLDCRKGASDVIDPDA